MTSRAILGSLPLLAALLGGCASDASRDMLVSDATWQQLKEPLDANAVVEIALRNRPDLRVGTQQAIQFAAEAEAAFYAYQGDWELESRLEKIVATDRADLAQEEKRAGNNLALLQRQAAVAEAQMAIASEQKERTADREKLNRLMGLSAAAIVWKTKPGLPPLPARDPGTAELQFLALDQRPDLQALRREDEAAAAVRALEVEIGAEVRQASRTMVLNRRQVELCRKTLLPVNERIVQEVQSAPASDLVTARQHELDGEREYVGVWRDYWIARAELEAAVGGNLDVKRERP